MTFNIDALEARKALGASKASWTRWVAHLPSYRTFHGVRGGGGSTPKQFRLSDLVPAIRAKRRGGFHGDELAALVALDTSLADPSQPLGEDADTRAAAFHAVLTDEERTRFARVSDHAAKAASEVLWGKGHLYNLGRCLGLLILRPEVLAYVLTGLKRVGLPDHTRQAWAEYAAVHIVATVRAHELTAIAETTQPNGVQK